MTDKNKQLANNEQIFVSNQNIIRDMYNNVQISKQQLESFTRFNINQFEERRNIIVFGS